MASQCFDECSQFSAESSHIGDLKRHLSEADDEFRPSFVRKLSEADLLASQQHEDSNNKKTQTNPTMNTEYMEGYIKCLAPAFQVYERRRLQQRESKKKNRVQVIPGRIVSSSSD